MALASVLGFGALLGLVTEHAVGSQRHGTTGTGRSAPRAAAGASSFFDANGPSYSFGEDDGSAPPPLVADSGSSSSSSQAPQSQAAAPPPVAQTSVS